MVLRQLGQFTKNIELSGGLQADEAMLDKVLGYQKQGFNFLVHNYFPPLNDWFILNMVDPRPHTQNFVQRSMEAVAALGLDYYSIHPGLTREYAFSDKKPYCTGLEFPPEQTKAFVDWFFAQYPNHYLAIENLYPVWGILDISYGMTLEQIRGFLELDPRVRLLLDLGHLKVAATKLHYDYDQAVTTYFEEWGHLIKEIHLSHNDGSDDHHQLVEPGSKQHQILVRYQDLINRQGINVTVEGMGYSHEELVQNHAFLSQLIN